MIYVTEEQIRKFAEQQGFARITCRCPVGTRSHRAATEELIKEMESVFPNARVNLAHAVANHGSDKALYS